jgi:hypothetical protein
MRPCATTRLASDPSVTWHDLYPKLGKKRDEADEVDP